MFACVMIACFAVTYINHTIARGRKCMPPGGCMGTRLYKVRRTQICIYHPCTIKCERVACDPYTVRSRD